LTSLWQRKVPAADIFDAYRWMICNPSRLNGFSGGLDQSVIKRRPPNGTVHYFDPDQGLNCTRTGLVSICSNL